MKNRLHFTCFILFLFILFSFNGFSKEFYFFTGGGYNFSAGTQQLAWNFDPPYTVNVSGSFGEGINGIIGMGYLFNENIGGELAYSFMKEKKFNYMDFTINAPGTMKASISRIIPSLVIAFGTKIKPYSKLGFIFNLNPKLNIEDYGILDDGIGYTYTVSKTENYTGGISIGTILTIGVDFILSPKFSIYSEINSINQSYRPTKDDYQITKSYSIGYTESSSGTIKFTDKVTSLSNQDEQLEPIIPFSSIGINVGVKFRISK